MMVSVWLNPPDDTNTAPSAVVELVHAPERVHHRRVGVVPHARRVENFDAHFVAHVTLALGAKQLA